MKGETKQAFLGSSYKICCAYKHSEEIYFYVQQLLQNMSDHLMGVW